MMSEKLRGGLSMAESQNVEYKESWREEYFSVS